MSGVPIGIQFHCQLSDWKKNDKANAFTRKPNKRPANNKDKRQKHRMQILLLPKCVKLQLIKVSDQLEKNHEPKQPKNHKFEQ